MTYKSKEERKKYYDKNKDEINKKRREHAKTPEVRERIRKTDAAWRSNNREKANRLSRISKKKYEVRAKKLVFEHYGKKCACCEEEEQIFLTIDHINGGGTKHRKKIKEKIYNWYLKITFQKDFKHYVLIVIGESILMAEFVHIKIIDRINRHL